ncbi:MAG TPA: Glu-tRNA(Gln) amidotransferase subunit GatE [Methanocella sp.]|nr:Glu-tRNA(Gln) amidotransferase subunit GatE [Methanocella sp.]
MIDYTDNIDYRAIGLKAGLEIHQQLGTRTKLFCCCPNKIRETAESNFEFFRYLRARESEMGEVDRAAAEQAMTRKRFVYKAYDTTCLIENDEEPPKPLNPEALKTALKAAFLFNMTPADEVFTMRKIVVDGSNTTGFQRTCFIASDGFIETPAGRVGMDTLCLEEDAASKVEAKSDTTIYSLDRLGIPLIEIATAPDIKSPAQAREVALAIGTLLRSLKVRRGLGTIRQDVNVSIAKGARVEIKGVQALDLIEQVVELEAKRQINLLAIKDELHSREAMVTEDITDITDIFKDSDSKVVKKALSSGGAAYAIILPGFRGLIGREIGPGRRLGTEFSDRAKRTAGVGGIFHIDELPNYGITQAEVDAVISRLKLGGNDAFVMVADTKTKAKAAIEAVMKRAGEAMIGIPEETRGPLPNGNTEYMRPLPGKARMYPETDVMSVQITREYLEKIKGDMPELLNEKKDRFMRQYGLNEEFAKGIAYSTDAELFEDLSKKYGNPTLIARTIHGTMTELRRDDVQVDGITEGHLNELFGLVNEGKIAKEAIPAVLKETAQQPTKNVEYAIKRMGLDGVGEDEVRRIIGDIVREKHNFIKEKGDAATSGLMGLAMQKLRGKADGKLINRILKETIQKELKE